MKKKQIAIFGQSEKALPWSLSEIRSLPELIDKVGHPPADSCGLIIAIQSLMYEKEVLYYCVAEEGLDPEDYQRGLTDLLSRPKHYNLEAIALPGVSDPLILEEAKKVAKVHPCSLIIGEKDLFDITHS